MKSHCDPKLFGFNFGFKQPTCISGWRTLKPIHAHLAFLHDFLIVIKKKKIHNALSMEYIFNFYLRFVALFVSQLTDSWRHNQRNMPCIPDISKYPSLVVIVISSGEKWLTSRLIFQLSCPVRISETPLVSCLGPFWFNTAVCWPLNGGRRGDCADPGREKDSSLLFAQSIHSRSRGSRKGGRLKSCAKMRLDGRGSQVTSRRKIGRGNMLFCSAIP